jgi:hypothetical protein
MFAPSSFSPGPMTSIASANSSSPGSGRRLSRNVAVSIALQLAESSKEQYYSLLQAFEEAEPAHCKSLLHTVDNQLLPNITAASSSLRSLALSAPSFDGILLETKSRELAGIIDSFASLRKLINEKASQVEAVSPMSSSTAAAIAAVASQRIAAASDTITAPLPPPPAANASAAPSGMVSSPLVPGYHNTAYNPFASLTTTSPKVLASPVSDATSSAAASSLAPPSSNVDSLSASRCLPQPQSTASTHLTLRVSGLVWSSLPFRCRAAYSHSGAGFSGTSSRSAPARWRRRRSRSSQRVRHWLFPQFRVKFSYLCECRLCQRGSFARVEVTSAVGCRGGLAQRRKQSRLSARKEQSVALSMILRDLI